MSGCPCFSQPGSPVLQARPTGVSRRSAAGRLRADSADSGAGRNRGCCTQPRYAAGAIGSARDRRSWDWENDGAREAVVAKLESVGHMAGQCIVFGKAAADDAERRMQQAEPVPGGLGINTADACARRCLKEAVGAVTEPMDDGGFEKGVLKDFSAATRFRSPRSARLRAVHRLN